MQQGQPARRAASARNWRAVALLLLGCAAGLTSAQSCAPPPPAKYKPPPEEMACGESTPMLIEDQPTGFSVCKNSGLRHRPEAKECPSYLPRSKREVLKYIYYGRVSASSYQCTSDEECSVHPHGYCRYLEPPVGSYCAYGCRSDSDCPVNKLCLCGKPIGECIPARCRSDGECQGNALCGEYFLDSETCFDTGFACQTPEDECAGLMCKLEEGPWLRGWCMLKDGHRVCEKEWDCGIP